MSFNIFPRHCVFHRLCSQMLHTVKKDYFTNGCFKTYSAVNQSISGADYASPIKYKTNQALLHCSICTHKI